MRGDAQESRAKQGRNQPSLFRLLCVGELCVYNKGVGAGFRWNAWNVAHVARHGIAPEEAEYAVTQARRPYPSYEGDGRWLVRGQGARGRFIQVVYVIDADGDSLYVIHARPLNDREKRNLRRRRR